MNDPEWLPRAEVAANLGMTNAEVRWVLEGMRLPTRDVLAAGTGGKTVPHVRRCDAERLARWVAEARAAGEADRAAKEGAA